MQTTSRGPRHTPDADVVFITESLADTRLNVENNRVGLIAQQLAAQQATLDRLSEHSANETELSRYMRFPHLSERSDCDHEDGSSLGTPVDSSTHPSSGGGSVQMVSSLQIWLFARRKHKSVFSISCYHLPHACCPADWPTNAQWHTVIVSHGLHMCFVPTHTTPTRPVVDNRCGSTTHVNLCWPAGQAVTLSK